MKRHALFVGVDQYADPAIQDLRCAVNDATELAGFFKHRALFDRAEVLANPRNSAMVLDHVQEMMDGLGAGDEFLFFFAGHGVKTQSDHRLVCAGDDLAAVRHSWDGLPLERLKFATAGACDRLFLLDACRTDVLATNRGAAGAMEKGTRDLILATASPVDAVGGTLTILCSCDDGESAGESLSLRHGLFSKAMLDVLEEEERGGRRVLVTDDFAYNLLPDRMRALAKESDMDFNQKPQKNGPPFLLLDGSTPAFAAGGASSLPRSYPRMAIAAPVLVVCPICGKKNEPRETFKCRGCGRDNLCLRHQDERTFLCKECVASKEREEEARRTHEEEEARRTREKAEAERKAKEERMTAVSGKNAGDRRILRIGSQEVALRWCPPGTFTMGSPPSKEGRYDDETQHSVTLTQGFWMGETEVTQGLWKEVMGSNPSRIKSGDTYPVESVSWDDCQKFIEKLNARSDVKPTGLRFALPTEAQWEYACRAGTTGDYGGTGRLDDMGWYDGNSGNQTHPVGQKEPNAWNLRDMHGNVREWCQDWYGNYPTGAVTDPTGPASGVLRVLRGGSYWRYARSCRSAYRNGSWPASRGRSRGLRLLALQDAR